MKKSISKNRTASPPQKSSKTNYDGTNLLADSLSLDEYIGNREAVKEVRRILAMSVGAEIYRDLKIPIPKGILLVGEPGTGKTELVKALVKEKSDRIEMIELSYPDIACKWVNATTENLTGFLTEISARSKSMHVIVFIDEIESMLPSRKNSNQFTLEQNKLVAQFLKWMDGGLMPLTNVTIFGTTNCIELIDEAFLRPGRFDKIIKFLPFDQDDAFKAIKLHFERRQIPQKYIGVINWKLIRENIKNKMTGAETSAVIKEALNDFAEQYMDETSENYKAVLFDTSFILNAIDANIQRNTSIREAKMFGLIKAF